MSNELTLLQRQAIGKMLHTLRCVRQYSLLIGTWEHPNVTLDLKANGHREDSNPVNTITSLIGILQSFF